MYKIKHYFKRKYTPVTAVKLFLAQVKSVGGSEV